MLIDPYLKNKLFKILRRNTSAEITWHKKKKKKKRGGVNIKMVGMEIVKHSLMM